METENNFKVTQNNTNDRKVHARIYDAHYGCRLLPLVILAIRNKQTVSLIIAWWTILSLHRLFFVT